MLRLGFIKRWFQKKPAPTKERIKRMTPELTPEYLETLQKEYQYVCVCLQFSSLKFPRLVNQERMNAGVLQQVNNDLAIKKTSLEVQIYALTEYLQA